MVSVLAAQRVRAIKTEGGRKNLENQYAIEMLNITKKFPGIIANDNITLQLKKGEIHALLGENGAGKSTLMSVLFGLYQPEEGIIKKDGKVVSIKDLNDATALGIGMVHQHFKLVDVFTVLDNIILGAETTKCGFLQKQEARKKVEEISKRYGLNVDLDAKVEDITVGMQQRVEILKMLYRDNVFLRQQKYDKAQNDREKKDGKNSVHVRLPMEFVASFPYCNTTRSKMCYNI